MNIDFDDLIKLAEDNKEISCRLNDKKVDSAKIWYDGLSNDVYICQDVCNGYDSPNKLGYKYSWVISREFMPLHFKAIKIKYNEVNFEY